MMSDLMEMEALNGCQCKVLCLLLIILVRDAQLNVFDGYNDEGFTLCIQQKIYWSLLKQKHSDQLSKLLFTVKNTLSCSAVVNPFLLHHRPSFVVEKKYTKLFLLLEDLLLLLLSLLKFVKECIP
jgi:hypothetical protein